MFVSTLLVSIVATSVTREAIYTVHCLDDGGEDDLRWWRLRSCGFRFSARRFRSFSTLPESSAASSYMRSDFSL